MTRPAGFTLVETLIVIVLVSLTSLIALPKFSDALTLNNVKSARAKITSLYASARASASSAGRPAFLHLAGNLVYVTRVSAPGSVNARDTITPPENVYTQYGVGVASTADSIMIDAAGLGREAATIIVARGVRVDTIQISQYGRILK